MSKLRLAWLSLAFALGCGGGAADDGGASCQAGFPGCECFSGGLCASGSVCLNGICTSAGGNDSAETGGNSSNSGDGDGDGGNTDPDGGDDCGPCPVNTTCENGECVGLGKCPCDPGAYCDLESGLCVEGCVINEDCPEGEYCDTVNKSCEIGCADDDACSVDQVCDQLEHTCVDPCAGCEDDGNPCTFESCASGSCQTGNLPYGEACQGADDGNECTVTACDGNGSCGPIPVAGGVECDVADQCNESSCDGNGQCEVDFQHADGHQCEDLYAAVCRNNQCVPTKKVCSWNTVYPDDLDVWLCGCGGATVFRYWWTANSPVTEVPCSQCISYNSTDVCYP